LYDRMLANLVGCWTRIAAGTTGASVVTVAGAVIGVFPEGPESAFYNNAVLARDLDASRAAEAVTASVQTYEEARVDGYAIWVHESEDATIAELERSGLGVDTTTRAMAMSLADITVPRLDIDLAPSDWGEYLRIIEVPDGTLEGVDPADFHVLIAKLDGESVTAGMAYDHDGDCGIYNVGTLAHARRRGLGTALTALHLLRAQRRGCTTASLQATKEAEGIYAGAGFRSLGRFIEYVR
jgi:ribosomal protein S18 acetylase RimI-like enzyme